MSGDRRQQRKRIAKAQAAAERFLEATSRQIDAQAALHAAILTGNPALKEQGEISGEVVAAFDRLGIASAKTFAEERTQVAEAVLALRSEKAAVDELKRCPYSPNPTASATSSSTRRRKPVLARGRHLGSVGSATRPLANNLVGDAVIGDMVMPSSVTWS